MILAYNFNPEITLGDIISAISVMIALMAVLTTLWFENKRHKEVAFKEIYQQLELASIELFRFESGNKHLVDLIWMESKKEISSDPAEHFILTNYVCQYLNLFEMAVRFKKEKVMPDDVFGSWITWVFDLCSAPGFKKIWMHCKYNYISDLRIVINAGIHIAEKELPEHEARVEFFHFMAEKYKSELILKWFETE